MLEVIGLACSRNDVVLFSNLSFQLLPGVVLQLRAANGLGKTTLLKTLVGILPLTVGQLKINSSLCYLGHKTSLHPALSPKQNLAFLCALEARDATASALQLTQALAFAGLSAQQDQVCAELSAGQCQRINLARLYLSQAKIWLLDEPFINLDATAKDLLLDVCHKHLTAGGSILLATHNDFAIANLQTIYLENYA